MIWVYFLKAEKIEALGRFRKLHEIVEKRQEMKVKYDWTDQGGKFIYNSLYNYKSLERIQRQSSTFYTTQ